MPGPRRWRRQGRGCILRGRRGMAATRRTTTIDPMKISLRTALLTAGLLVLGACGDPDTDDPRGYTKAPTENPGWTVEGEAVSDMAELGDPDRLPTLRADEPGDEDDEAESPAAE